MSCPCEWCVNYESRDCAYLQEIKELKEELENSAKYISEIEEQLKELK